MSWVSTATLGWKASVCPGGRRAGGPRRCGTPRLRAGAHTVAGWTARGALSSLMSSMSLTAGASGSGHTRVTVQFLVTASDIDHTGRLSCGHLLKQMDIAACMSAERHCMTNAVTLTMDDVNFSEAKCCIGDVVLVRARVNRVWNTSMEVGLRVDIESPVEGHSKHLASSYLVFVALNEKGEKVSCPPLAPATEKERIRWALAADRRQIRLDRQKIVEGAKASFTTGHLRYSLTTGNGKTGTDSARMNPMLGDTLAMSPSLMQEDRAGSVNPHISRTSDMIAKDATLRRISASLSPGGGSSPDGDDRNVVTWMVLPQHGNHHGHTFGGQILAWSYEAAQIAAVRHARCPVVAVSVDDVYFVMPSRVGTRVVLKASVNRVFNRSMEVGVRVEGHEQNGTISLINRAYFTMVALDSPTSTAGEGASSLQSRASISTLTSAGGSSAPAKRGFAGAFGKKKTEDVKGDVKEVTLARAGPPALRLLPLSTPEQKRRHQDALGRRRVRLERLQLRSSNHLAWPFTPETDPRSFVLQNLMALKRVASDNPPESPDEPSDGVWERFAQMNEVSVWTKTSMTSGVSLKSECVIGFPLPQIAEALLNRRRAWDTIVVKHEVVHTFASAMEADIIVLAVDARPINPKSKPTDFSLLRSWRREPNGFVLASHSVIHQAGPVDKNYVRAETGSSGFVLKRLAPNKTSVTYVLQLNPAGTSIVASELDGSSKLAGMRMEALAMCVKNMLPGEASLINEEWARNVGKGTDEESASNTGCSVM